MERSLEIEAVFGGMGDQKGRSIRRFACPNCACALMVPVYHMIGDVENDDSPPATWRESLSQSELELLESAERDGLVAAFDEAYDETPNTSRSPDAGRHFMAYLRAAVQCSVSKWALDRLEREFGGRIETWTHMGVVGVASDRVLRAFYPQVFTKGRKAKVERGVVTRAAQEPDPARLFAWIKTRHGYVASPGQFLDQLRARSIGAFQRIRP